MHDARISIATIVFCQIALLGGLFAYGRTEAALFRKASAYRDFVPGLQTLPILEARPYLTLAEVSEVSIDEGALVPEMGPAGTTADTYMVPPSDLVSTYIVRSGDTVGAIAEMFGVSTNTLKWANPSLQSGALRVGQELTILPVSGVNYTVKKGDTLKSIAARYSGDADDIASYNGLGIGEALAVGDKIIIPDGELGSSLVSQSNIPKSASKTSGNAVPSGYYIRPVAGVVTQGKHGPHEAFDIGAKIGTSIYAMADGKVLTAYNDGGYHGGYGNLVVIAHNNGSQTWLAHMSKVVVSVGQTVSQGEKIGEVGSTGHSTGPHLHYEVRGVPTPLLYPGTH